MLGTAWRPSKIEDEIYGILEDYEVGTNLYEYNATNAVTDLLVNYCPTIQWQLGCSEWPDCTGGVCAVSWIEDGTIHTIMFDYTRGVFDYE